MHDLNLHVPEEYKSTQYAPVTMSVRTSPSQPASYPPLSPVTRTTSQRSFKQQPAQTKQNKREVLDKILSIPVIFVVVVLLFVVAIAGICISLSITSQNSIVYDSVTNLQDEISRRFSGVLNGSTTSISATANSIGTFVDSLIVVPPNDTEIMLYTYPVVMQYLISQAIYNSDASGMGLWYNHGKTFGAGHRFDGTTIWESFPINGTFTTLMTLLPPNNSFAHVISPDPNPVSVLHEGLPPMPVCGQGYWLPILLPHQTGDYLDAATVFLLDSCFSNQTLRRRVYMLVGYQRVIDAMIEICEEIPGKIFITDPQGNIVGSSSGVAPFILGPKGPIQVKAENCSDATINEAYKLYRTDPKTSQTSRNIRGVNYFMVASPFVSGNGINWTIIHLVESDPFEGPITAYTRRSVIICAVVAGLAILIAVGLSFVITRPIARLTRHLQRVARMEFYEGKDPSTPILYEAKNLFVSFLALRSSVQAFTKFIPSTLIKTRIDYNELNSLKEIGSGAFGVVYKGEWRGRDVAVKMIKGEFMDDKSLRDFLGEVSILQGLETHPNLVLFLAATFPPQPLTMVTEFCGGGSLYNYVREYQVSTSKKLSLLRDIGESQPSSNQLTRIVHRDLALRNILLGSDLTAKVCDFGMSRTTQEESGGKTQSTTGPLKWMSPESIRFREYSVKSDVWSFGVTIWELMEVSDPYPSLTAIETAYQVVHNDLRLQVPTSAPAWVQNMMKGCWETDPEARPTMNDICNIVHNPDINSLAEVDKEKEPSVMVVTVEEV
ncbi:hypothetical protein PROFUN_04697 [Planoprotostelium fungivorum]|uniref:Protein kinase domain-containing protein n=1 Tax=Planoprotostelium fungivorum TaxID=1890364 RepID=A0A2P6NFV4_9EUKA|nr:hypothetical protein PROFUN_04697 [Planoprotostelium fungivorum]